MTRARGQSWPPRARSLALGARKYARADPRPRPRHAELEAASAGQLDRRAGHAHARLRGGGDPRVRRVAAQRDREAEFKAEAEASDLLARLDQADRDLDELLGSATAADLTELRPRGDRPPRPGLDWLMSNYGHAREHLAQIELTKQIYDSRT